MVWVGPGVATAYEPFWSQACSADPGREGLTQVRDRGALPQSLNLSVCASSGRWGRETCLVITIPFCK